MKKIRSCERGVRTLVSVTAVLIGILSVSSNTAATPFCINTEASSPNVYAPSVGSNGTAFLVTQESEVSIVNFKGRHVVSTGGGQVDDIFAFTLADETRLDAATAGTSVNGNFLTVWDNVTAIKTQRSTLSSATAGVVEICGGSGDQPDIAFGASNYLVVYREQVTSYFDIYGDRVDPSTNTKLGRKLIAAHPNGHWNYGQPAAAFDGTNYLVVWQTYYDGTEDYIMGTRVDQNGNPLDTPFFISTDYYMGMPDVAFGGGHYLVVWLDLQAGDACGRDVTTGGVCGTEYTIDGGNCASGYPDASIAVAHGNGYFRICWQQNDALPGYPIYYREMNASTGAMTAKNKCNGAGSEGYVPDIAYANAAKGDEFLVVWHQGDEIWGNFNCNELYVELVGFDACSRQGYILLDWRTEVEVDNSHWVIKKRTEGESEWKELVRVPAKPAGPNTYTHRDSDVRPGATYWYQLGDIDTNGKLTWHPEVKVKYTGTTSPSQLKLAVAPTISVGIFRLKYQIPGSASAEQQMPVSLKVYDAGGRLAHTLFEGTKSAGSYSTTWHPEEAPGIYFCELRVGGKRAVKKLIWCEDSRHCGCD